MSKKYQSNFTIRLKNAVALDCRVGKQWDWIRRDLFIRNGHWCSNATFYNLDYDFDGKIIIPVFYNLHAHLGESLFEHWEKRTTLKEYLTRTEEFHSYFSPKDQETLWNLSANYTLDKLIKNGIGYLGAARCHSISYTKHLRGMSLYPVMDSAKLKCFSRSIADFDDFATRARAMGFQAGILLHSLYYSTPEDLEFVKACVKKHNCYLVMHIAEDAASFAKENAFSGDCIEAVIQNGLLNAKTLLVHGCCLTSRQLDCVAKTKAMICICPESNLNIGSLPLNPSILNKKNIPWCIATDGAGTAKSLSLLSQISVLKKLFPANEISDLMAGVLSSPACFLGHCLGSCFLDDEPANFQVYSLQHDLGSSIPDLLQNLLNQDAKLEQVWLQGKIQYWS